MELGRYLTVKNFNELAQVINERLLDELQDAGYEVQKIDAIPTVNWYTQPTKIKSEIFDKMEKILYDIDGIVDWVNPYSRDLFVYAAKNGMLYSFVKRWFDWYEYNDGIINNKYEKQQYLFVSDTNEQIYDVNGDPILTLAGFFKRR